jgi:RHS repeat-associated protein
MGGEDGGAEADWAYEYDLLNRLQRVTKNGKIVSSYRYDPEGFRVVKQTAEQTIHYVFEGTEPIFEKNITTGQIKSYVYALGKHLARVDGVIGDPEAKVYFYHTDHLGSIKAVTNKTGEVVWNADYLAFGTSFGETSDSDFEEWHGFTGKEYDPDTGLSYFNARWYDSELGRFISEDPVMDPNNPNLYVYCANNPLVYIDPTGQWNEESKWYKPWTWFNKSDDGGGGTGGGGSPSSTGRSSGGSTTTPSGKPGNNQDNLGQTSNTGVPPNPEPELPGEGVIISEIDRAMLASLKMEYKRYEEFGDRSGMDAVKRVEAVILRKYGVSDNYKYNSEKITTVIELMVMEINNENVDSHNGVRDRKAINASLYTVGLIPGSVGLVATIGSAIASDKPIEDRIIPAGVSLLPKGIGQAASTFVYFTDKTSPKPLYDVQPGDIYVMSKSITDRGIKITVTQNYFRNGILNYTSGPWKSEIEGRYRSLVSSQWEYD